MFGLETWQASRSVVGTKMGGYVLLHYLENIEEVDKVRHVQCREQVPVVVVPLFNCILQITSKGR